MLIALSKKENNVVSHWYGRGQTSIKMVKYDFLKIWGKLQIWEKLKAKNLKAYFLIGNASLLTHFKETENRFSISCLVCTTELTKYTTYGKLH